MADISKIILPNGSEYNLKDSISRAHATDSNKLNNAIETAGLYKIAATSQGHVKALQSITKQDLVDLGLPSSNTHRPIQVNGTQILGNNATAVNLQNGVNVNLSNSGGTVTISAPDVLPLTGGNVTGPVNFGDSVTIDEANIGDLVVTGNSSFTNNLQVNTINGVAVGNNPTFTDTMTTVTTTGSGNAVTEITASNGVLTVNKDTTFLTSHQDISGKADKVTTVSTINWDSTNKKLTQTTGSGTTDVVTAATLRTSLNVANGAEVNQNAFSNIKVGSTTVAADTKTDTLELVAGNNVTLTPDATNDKVTITATDTTYQSKAAASGGTAVSLVTTGQKYTWNNKTSNTGTVTKVTAGTGLSIGSTAGGNFTTSGTINHTNAVTAQNTQAIYPIKIDAQGHISAYGSAVTPLTASSTLDATKLSGTIPTTCLPSYVDDVLEYTAKANFPATGQQGKIYVDKTTNLTWRWGGSAYVQISPSLALGTTSSTAYRGDYGNTAYTHATDSNRLTTATSSGLYKIAATAQGHVASLTAVTKADITDLGIPGSDTNTKNTAGSTNSSKKLFLIGAETQAANPQTYSQDTAYVGTDGKLYSNSKVVLTGGSNASSAVTITPSTTNVYSMTSVGSVTPGAANTPTVIDTTKFSGGSFTRGTFNQGTLPTLTFAMDTTDTKKLKITFGQGTLPTHAADSFTAAALQSGFYTAGTANTPTAVTLPGRSSVIKAWTGYTAATAAAQTFTGSSD